MDDLLRLGRPKPLLQTDDDQGDGLYLDNRTALREDVLGAKDSLDPRLMRRVAVQPQPDETQTKPFIGFGLSSAAPAPVANEAPRSALSTPTQSKERPEGYVGFGLSSAMRQPEPEPEQPKAKDEGAFMHGLKQGGIEEAKSAAVGGAALLADTVGAKDTAGKLMGKYSEMQKETQANAKPYESFSNVLEGKASFGDFFQNWAGYALGQAAQTVATGLVGAGVGSVVPGAGTVAGAIEGVVARGAAQAGLKKMLANKLESEVAGHMAANAAKGMAEKEAEKLAYEQAAKSVMKAAGASAAISGQNLMMEGASIYGDAKEMAKGGDVDLGKVWMGAVGAAAVDTVSDLFALKGLSKTMGGDGFVRNLLTESFKGGLREGSTEAVQTGFERFGAGKDLSSAEAIRDYIDSAAAGSVGGVLFGSIKGTFGKRGGEEDKSLTLDDVRASFEKKLESEDGRQELFDGLKEDPKVAAALRAAGISDPSDPRFDSVVRQALHVKEMLAAVEPISEEERQKRTKERGADVQAAFGDTASTAVGSNMGANEPLIQRESVTPNEQTKTLEGEAQPVTLPETQNGTAGTLAMSGEDLIQKQRGFEVMPTFQIGDRAVGNNFVSMAAAETFLFGPKDKKTGERAGGYAESVDDMQFEIRKGQRAKANGGGHFYFIEGRRIPDSAAKIDEAAHQAATSPNNELPQPTEAQKSSGNYKKGHVTLHGLNIAIENPAGSQRSGTDPSGKAWSQTMQHHYGYVKGTVGKDKDHVDVFIGKNPDSQKVFVVDQINKDGTFDEHKALLGFDTEAEARAAYLSNYEPGWTGLGSISEMPVQAFKSWVKDGVKGKPLSLPVAAPAAEAPKQTVEQKLKAKQKAKKEAAKVESKPEEKADAVQEQSTGKVDVRQPAEDGKAVVEGNTKPQEPARESKAEEAKPVEAKQEEVKAAKAPTKAEKKRSWGDRARSNLHDRDPFKAFLGRYGISSEYAGEFVPGLKERRAFMAPGFGPIFRRTGLPLDDLQLYAAERGFLPDNQRNGHDGYQKLYEMIADCVRGKPHFELNNEDGIDRMNAMREEALQAQNEQYEEGNHWLSEEDDGYAQAEREAIQALDEVSDDVLFDLDDVAIDGESNVDIATAMAALGFTEQEIQDEINRRKQGEETQASEGAGEAPAKQESRSGESTDGKEGAAKRPEVDPAKLKKLKERINTAYEDGALDLEDVIRLEKMGEDGDLMGVVREMNEIAQLNKGWKAPRYRVTTVGDTGMTKAAVEKILAAVTSKWANMPEVKVVATEDDLPIKQLTRIKKADMAGKVPGMYVNGKVWLIAGNIHDAKDAVLTIAHEISGHYGLRSILGEGHAAKMRELFKGNATVRKLAGEMMVKEGLSVEEATEEVLADMAESGKDLEPEIQSALKRIYAAIRKFLREVAGIAYATDAEIKQIVGNARRYVIEGDIEAAEGGAKAADESMKNRTQLKGGTPTFYSALERATRAAKQESAQAKDWVAIISKLPGVKKEEVEWTGVNDWLALQTGKVTKQQVLDFIAGNKLRLNDVILSGPGTFATDETIRETYADMMGVSAEDIDLTRDEMLSELSLPHLMGGTKHNKSTGKTPTVLPGGKRYVELVITEPSNKTMPYKEEDSIHFGDVAGGKHIGWLRMNIRKDVNGNDVLFLEEIQSQRGQDGQDKIFFKGDKDAAIDKLTDRIEEARMAYINSKDGTAENERALAELNVLRQKRDELRDAVPDAPFVKDTKAWTALLLKRAIAYAQEQGISRVAWTTGEQQVARYDLSKQVSEISYDTETENLIVRGTEGNIIKRGHTPKAELPAVIGKDVADKLLSEPTSTSGMTNTLKGLDVRMGGTGLSRYYNSIVPSVAKDIVGKNGMDGKVEVMDIEGTGQQLGFVIPEKLQQIVAEDGLPMFRRKDYEAQYADMSPAAREIALRKGHYSPPTIRERVEALRPNFWRRIVQGTFDQFRSVKDFSLDAYMRLRIANGPQDGALSALLYYGQVFNDDGALNLKKGTKGLLEVLAPVGEETDRFLLWMAANRAKNLKAQDRERFFSNEEINALKDMHLGTMRDGKSRAAVYTKTLQDMNELNRSVLDIARTNGLIDQEAFNRFSNDIWYVPFYRNMDNDQSLSSVQTSSSMTGQKFSKKLKGSERPLNDLMENVLMNWSHILSASMKNEAAVVTLKDASSLGIVSKITPFKDNMGKDEQGNVVPLKGTVKVMEGGKEVRYRIDDEFVFASLNAVASMPQWSVYTQIGREFKTTLTRFVSLSPTFKLNNLLRDSVQAMAVSELKGNPIKNVMEGYRAYHSERGEALAGGALFAMGNAFDGDMASNVKHLIRKGVPNHDIWTTDQKVKEGLKNLWDKYDEFSDASENSNRLALYNQLRASGASHLEAAYAARDLQDFSLQGGFMAVRFLSQILPYFNARLQGLYKLGKDGLDPVVQVINGKASDGERQKAMRFAAVTSAVTIAGIALYLSQKDDDDYKALEDWERDSFFWFKIPGTQKAIRIPKPFEIGAFETIVERLTEQMVDEGVEGKVFAQRLLNVFSQNLAINPIPQVVRPLKDIIANTDAFTGRSIESMGMEHLSKENRMNQGTSAVGIGLNRINSLFAHMIEGITGGAINANDAQLSPIQYDHLIRGYLGWVGSAAMAVSNVVAAPVKAGESSRYERIDDFFVVGNYVKNMPQSQSRYVTSFYENAKDISMTMADMQNFIKLGQIDRAQALQEEKGDVLALSKMYSTATKTLSELNKQARMIEDDTEMDGAEKRGELERLAKLRSDYAKEVETFRIQMKRGKTEAYADGGEVDDGDGAAKYGTRWVESASEPVAAKGSGYMGAIANPKHGGVSTELSASDEKGSYPLIVPTLTKDELKGVMDDNPSESAQQKARSWAESKRAKGEDTFQPKVGLRYPRPAQ